MSEFASSIRTQLLVSYPVYGTAEFIEKTFKWNNVNNTIVDIYDRVPLDEFWIVHRVGICVQKEATASFDNYFVAVYRRWFAESLGHYFKIIAPATPSETEMEIYGKDNQQPLILMPDNAIRWYVTTLNGNIRNFIAHAVYQRVKLDRTKVIL